MDEEQVVFSEAIPKLHKRVGVLVDMLKEIAMYQVVRAYVRVGSVISNETLIAMGKRRVLLIPDCYS
jgi:hypothetical protein